MRAFTKKKKRSKFKKKDVGIPKYLGAQETLDTPCHICSGKIIYTSSKDIYNQKTKHCYKCEDCKARVSCKLEKEKLRDGRVVYKPLGLVEDKEARQLRIRCHQVIDSRWKYYNTMKRSTAYRKLAVGMNIPAHTCHFAWMNKKQLAYALDILCLTNWTQNKFL